jgi:hypothetical protein
MGALWTMRLRDKEEVVGDNIAFSGASIHQPNG